MPTDPPKKRGRPKGSKAAPKAAKEAPKKGKPRADMWHVIFGKSSVDFNRYDGIVDPVEFVRQVVADTRLHLRVRFEAAVALMPYVSPRMGIRPYVPSADELQRMKEANVTTVRLIEFKEMEEGGNP